MLKKLRKRFIFINMLLVSVVLLVTFISLLVTSANRMQSDSFRELEEGFVSLFDEQVNYETERTNEDYKGEDTTPPQKDIPNLGQPSFRSFYITIDENGDVINVYDLRNEISIDTAQIVVDEAISQNDTSGEIDEFQLRYMIKDFGVGQVYGFIDTSYEKDFIQQQGLNYLLIGLLSMAAFFCISLVLSNMAIKPITKAWTQQQQFVADASHELKTPITVMMANTSILLSDKGKNEEEQKKWINYIDLEAKRMKKLVEDLLFLARLDNKEKANSYNRISLSDALKESVLPFEAVLFESGKELQSDITEDVYIRGDIGQIKQLISILLDNANKYAYDKTCIDVKLYRDNNKAIIRVNNIGEPISNEDIAHIFDRFYRIDKARGREDNSYGLGLAIAKEIASEHHGKISVTSEQSSGTTFIVEIPLAE